MSFVHVTIIRRRKKSLLDTDNAINIRIYSKVKVQAKKKKKKENSGKI